jgi:hypothetical protein
MEIPDPLSGKPFGVYYRMPTTKERVAYARKLSGGRNDNPEDAVDRVYAAREEFGFEIITGVRDGDLGIEEEVGSETKPISSTPESPDYCEKWKDVLKDSCADLILKFAAKIFEGEPFPEEFQEKRLKMFIDEYVKANTKEEEKNEIVPFESNSKS